MLEDVQPLVFPGTFKSSSNLQGYQGTGFDGFHQVKETTLKTFN